jgi:demethylmenaquinone methyltransferase/2-methoxy-6-polyprenyl-1,4-benzoquinol methylase
MAELSGKEREDYVRRMFARLAGRYDLVNRWMTWGQDNKWRSEVIRWANIPPGGRLLDIGTGTGDLARLALHGDEKLFAVGADFSAEMMRAGRNLVGGSWINWLNSDALRLPFASQTFDAVVSGYLLRNVANLEQALAEQYRVLKVGGHMVCLDSTPPARDVWHLPVRLYLDVAIPLIGGLLSGDVKAYRYLPQSTKRFLPADELARCMENVGFRDVHYHRFMAGTMAIHCGVH